VYALLRPERFLRGAAMTGNGWLQIILFFLVILAITRPLGSYLLQSVPRGRPGRCQESWGRSSDSCCVCAA
jgi:hypothetical protein